MPTTLATEKPKQSWIQWFCTLEGHEFLLPVDYNFIADKMNLVQIEDAALNLNLGKKRIGECLRLLNAKTQPSEEDLQSDVFLQLNQDTSDLYGLIHARYVRSPEGKPLIAISLFN